MPAQALSLLARPRYWIGTISAHIVLTKPSILTSRPLRPSTG
ncbi:hypothetical protein [Paenibacillus hemerocallicola]|nr:hypothetical protein [Paenibacillus hemerocallicola]